ncbi:hypothetical protein ACFWDI_28520 [Streptomyces sp. NPDC060064]|uniref:hypothetical protein n=1 Tax=Streptomyces sp. NPDC060064 TaxID=3347049 RepID=UPI0036BE027F
MRIAAIYLGGFGLAALATFADSVHGFSGDVLSLTYGGAAAFGCGYLAALRPSPRA